MRIQDMQKLHSLIKEKYKSLERPDFAFVNKVSSLKPYNSMIQIMAENFKVDDISDLNEDVSFRYLLSNGKKQWVLELSMVGRFATILRVSDTYMTTVVTPNTDVKEELKIFKLLIENKFQTLDQQELEQPFSMRLFNTDPENVCVYQVLFSDVDILPWNTAFKREIH